MDERQKIIHGAILRINAELAGLYSIGCELMPRIEEPGAARLLGHIGRELNLGVLRYLAKQEGYELPSRDPSSGGNRHASEIGAALGLEENHPLVRTWLRIHNDLVGGTHHAHEGDPPPPSKVYEAFNELGAYLYGRIGPYFGRQDEMVRFLQITEPSESDFVALLPFLAHPQHRRYFFAHLTNPTWIRLARTGRLFDNIPGLRVFPDQSFMMRAWPEGEALVRLAEQAPVLTVEILESVPDNCDNPRIWKLVAEAALNLPMSHATRLVPKLRKAFRTKYQDLFPSITVKAMVRFAGEKQESAYQSAFLLADSLTFIRNSREIPEFEGSEENRENAREEWARQLTLSSTFRPFEFWEMLEKIVKPLEALDAERLFKLLVSRLRKALRVEGAELGRQRISSHYWCDTLEASDSNDEIPTLLAVAATQVGKRAIEFDPTHSDKFLALLPESGSEIWGRIRIALLTSAGEVQQDTINALIVDREFMDPEFGARESSALLRKCFTGAPPEVQEAFVRNLELGPDYYQSHLESAKTDADRAEAETIKVSWQCRILRRFRDKIPARLLPIAERLGVDGRMPSYEQRELDEVGHYSSGVASYGGPASPVTLDELRSMSLEEVSTLLGKWDLNPHAFREPSAEGLSRMLSDLLSEWPANGQDIIRVCLDSPNLSLYIAGLRYGVRQALENGKAVPWSVVRGFGQAFLAHQEHQAVGTVAWQRAARDFLEMIEAGTARDAFPLSDLGAISESLVGLVHEARLFEEDTGHVRRPLTSFQSIQDVARTSLPGHFLQAVVAVGESERRICHNGKLDAPDLKWIPTILEHSLSVGHSAPALVEAQVGWLIVRLRYLVPEWVDARHSTLFEEGMTAPMKHPAWGSYLNSGMIYLYDVKRFRETFVAAVSNLRTVSYSEAKQTGNDDSKISRRFLSHVLWGYLEGIFELGESSRIVEQTFESTLPEDHRQVLWAVFRQWSDAADPQQKKKHRPSSPSKEQVVRFVALWEWRLTALGAALERDPRDENARAGVDALGWMMTTPFVPDEDVIRLAELTLRLAPTAGQLRLFFWDRLSELAATRIDDAIRLADLLLRIELSGQVWIDFSRVAPIFRLGLKSSNAETRESVRHMINDLGSRAGLQEFGTLLKEVD